MVKLGKVTVIYTGTGFPKELQGCKEGKYPFYKVGDISKNVLAGYKKLMLCDNYIEEDAVKKIKGKILPKDTVVFAKIGEAVKLNRRAITTKECLVDNNVMGIAPVKSFMDINYLYYYMSFVKLENLAEATTVPSVKKGMIEDLEIDLPTLDTQRIISNIISEVDDLILLINKQLDDLNVIVKSRFIEMFGNPKDNPKRFKSIRIGELTDVLTGSTPNRSNKDYYEGKIPWVKTGEIHPGYINSTEECISEVALKETTCKLLPVDTVMIAMYGQGKTRGQSGILGIKAATNQACAAILPCEKLNPVFLNQYLVIEYSRLRDMGRGAQQANLNLSMIKNYHILSIPIELQTQFADFVAQVDKSKFVVTAKFQ